MKLIRKIWSWICENFCIKLNTKYTYIKPIANNRHQRRMNEKRERCYWSYLWKGIPWNKTIQEYNGIYSAYIKHTKKTDNIIV